jgi:hypothetical protein
MDLEAQRAQPQSLAKAQKIDLAPVLFPVQKREARDGLAGMGSRLPKR